MRYSGRFKTWAAALLLPMVCAALADSNAASPMKYLYIDETSSRWFNAILPIYESPGGPEIGTFKLIATNSWCLVDWVHRGKRVGPLAKRDKYWFDKCYNIYVHGERSGYFHVLKESIEGGVWVKKQYEMPSVSSQPIEFHTRSVLDGLKRAPAFAINGKPGIKVRSKPSEDADIVAVLGKDNIISSASGNFDGLWAEVEIFEVSGFPTEEHEGVTYEMPCASRHAWEPFRTKTFKGWIKALDDDGYPGELSWNTEC